MKPIFIPSKGRAGKTAFLKELNEAMGRPIVGLQVFVFVEPQELQQYVDCYPNLVITNLKENNRGLSYSRNQLYEAAKQNGFSHYWFMDDDVKLFSVDAHGKMARADIWMLELVEDELISGGYALAGLEYRQYAWSNPGKKSFNTYCDCVVLHNVEALEGIKCDENLQLKIDRDLAIQVVRAGMQTIRISSMCFSSPENGSNQGGLQSVYKQGLEEVNCDKMVAKWGESICTKFKKESGRIDIKINWNNINQYSLL